MSVVDMDQFVSDQKRLLSLEREAELEEANLLQSQSSIRELCQKGVALQRLMVGGSVTGLFGRTVVTFVSRVAGQELASHSLSPGDILGVRGTDRSELELSGVLTKVTATKVSLAFQQSVDELGLADHDNSNYCLVKLANDITYRRLTAALTSLSSTTSKPSLLTNVLFGVSSPGLPHQNLPPALINRETGQVCFYNQGLDKSQQEAVEFALKQKEVAVVHGPPGTGKTTTLVEIVRQAMKAGDKVLVTAPSNVAVDNLVERLVREGVRVVRLGHPARVSSTLQHHTLDAQIRHSDEGELVRDIYKELDQLAARKGDRRKLRGEVKELRKELKVREKKAIKEILGRADVVLGTLTSAGPDGPLKHLAEEHFKLTVIDECSQALEMACWIVAGGACKLVLAGDHLQLPPTILCSEAAKGGLEVSLMERVIKMYGDTVTRQLTVQYRMNESIMRWSSEALYSGRLTAHPSVASHRLGDLPGVQDCELTNTVLLLVDTAGCSMEELTSADQVSKANEGETALVCHHVHRLVEQGVAPVDIAVVSPYNLQVELLRLNLRPSFPSLEIKSVDGYQGREKEVVVLSLVRSNSRGEVGFLSERRRLNVAVTRARRQLVVICDSDTVKKDKFLAGLLDYMEQRGEVTSASLFSDDLPTVQRPEGLQSAAVAESTVSGRVSDKSKVAQDRNSIATGREKKKQISKERTNPVQRKIKCENVSKPKVDLDVHEDVDDRREEYEQVIANFVSSKELNYSFPATLNSWERRLVHELAEESGLVHESVGEGKGRQIILRKEDKRGEVGKIEVIPSTSESPQTKSSIVAVVSPHGGTTSAITCSTCQKSVPRPNIELHKVRCADLSSDICKDSKENLKPEKRKKKKKVKEEVATEELFDELCEKFQNLDKVCNFSRCKTLVSTIGVNCQYCKVRFCLHHSMAEVHGCGAAAKMEARTNISREGRLVPGSGKVNHKPDPDKRAQLARRLDKKLGQMQGQRIKKEKEK